MRQGRVRRRSGAVPEPVNGARTLPVRTVRPGAAAGDAPRWCAVTTATTILVLVVVVALSFDFTNGSHDAANATATSPG